MVYYVCARACVCHIVLGKMFLSPMLPMLYGIFQFIFSTTTFIIIYLLFTRTNLIKHKIINNFS